MKRLTTFLLVTLLSTGAVAASMPPAAAYSVSLSGREISRGEGGLINLVTSAGGDLSGGFTARIKQEGGQISGGEWSLIVVARGEDGNDREVGSLRGSFAGGSLTLAEDGSVSAVNDASLTVTEGAGAYAGASGSGSLHGSATKPADNPFTGSLTLSF
jgi:hypothetical protein